MSGLLIRLLSGPAPALPPTAAPLLALGHLEPREWWTGLGRRCACVRRVFEDAGELDLAQVVVLLGADLGELDAEARGVAGELVRCRV